MSKFFIRNSGSWVSPETVDIGGTSGNQSVSNIYYRKAGAWEEVWPGLLNIDASGILITIEHNDTFVNHGGSIGIKPSYYFQWALHTRFPNPFDHYDNRRGGQFPEIFFPQRICDYENETRFLCREPTAFGVIGSTTGSKQITNWIRLDESRMNASEFALATTLNEYQIYINLANLETVYPSTHPVWDLSGALGDEFRFALMSAWHPDTPGSVDKSVDYTVEWFQGGTLTYNSSTERYYIASPTNSETESFTVTPADADQTKYAWSPDTDSDGFWDPSCHELDYNFCVTQISYNWQNSTAQLVPTGSKPYTEPYDLAMPRYIYVEVEGDTYVPGYLAGVSYIDSPDVDTSEYTPVTKYDIQDAVGNLTSYGNYLTYTDYEYTSGTYGVGNVTLHAWNSETTPTSGTITAGQDTPLEYVLTTYDGANLRMDSDTNTATSFNQIRNHGQNAGTWTMGYPHRSNMTGSNQTSLNHRFWLDAGDYTNSNGKGSVWYLFNVYQYKWDNPSATSVTLKFNAYMNDVSLDQDTVTNVYKINPPNDRIDCEEEDPTVGGNGYETTYGSTPFNDLITSGPGGSIIQIGTANIAGNVTSVTSSTYEPQTGDNQVTVTINYETGNITVS